LVTWHRRQRDSWNLKVDVGFLAGTDTSDAILWLNVIMAELRKDPILGDWVILAPERALRPFDHEIAGVSATRDLCPFCRGNESATPAAVMTVPDGTSPDDWAVRIVPNRYPAVLTAALGKSTFEFTEQAPATGHHEVIIESPSHDQAMRDLSEDQVVRVVRAWRDRLAAVSREAGIAHTMIFKNEGAAAGASLEHVHSQLLATSFVPVRIEAELEAGRAHFEQTGKNAWSDMLERELSDGKRIIAATEQFVLLCPFASRFPGEMCLYPREPSPAFEAAPDSTLQPFTNLLRNALRCLHDVFPDAPINLGLHTAPPRDIRSPCYCWHLAITPRLTGIAGFEIGAGSWINVTAPEDAASRYRQSIDRS